MPEIKVYFNKFIVIKNAVEYPITADNISYEQVIKKVTNTLMANGLSPRPPTIIHSVVDKKGVCSSIIIQVKEELDKMPPTFKKNNRAKVGPCLYVRFIGVGRDSKYAYEKISVFAYENDIKLRDENYTVFVEESEGISISTGCSDFIEKLPLGYDTFLEEAGANLSAGEKQRLGLARALISEPEVLILDEATSNLDFISEKKFYDALFKSNRKCTTIIVAHRLSTIKNCDEIFVIDKGKIVERGIHHDLLEITGHYYKLWSSQIGYVENTKDNKDSPPKPDVNIDKSKDEIEY